MWPLATVATVKEAIPAAAVIEPIRTAATASFFSRPVETASRRAPSTPPTSMVQASQVCQPLASRTSRQKPLMVAVTPMIMARAPQAR